MRAAIYRRVSTYRQAKEDTFSLNDQLEKCTQWCKSEDYEIVADLSDIHSGGDLDGRPCIHELRRMIHKRQIDVVVLTTLDRLARDTNHQTVIMYEAEKYGVRVELTEERYEDSPSGKIMRAFGGIFSEIERTKFLERSLRGKRQRVQQGLMLPGPFPLYGYRFADKQKSCYVINPETAPIAIRIWNEAASGKSLRSIATDLTADGILTPRDQHRKEKNDPTDPPRGEKWSRMAIRHMIANPAYCGQHSAFRFDYTKKRRDIDTLSGRVRKITVASERAYGEGRVLLSNTCPALVSEELAQAVQARLKYNKLAASRNNRHPEMVLLRGGHIKCGLCGGNLTSSFYYVKGNIVPTYQCTRALAVATGSKLCRGNWIRAEGVDQAVWEDIISIFQDPVRFKEEAFKLLQEGGNQDAIEAMTQRLKQLDQQEDNIVQFIRMDANASGVERLRAEMERIAAERHRAQHDLEQLKLSHLEWESACERVERIANWSPSISKAADPLSYQDKRAILYALNIRVTIFPRGNIPRYTCTAGLSGEIKLPVRYSDAGASHCVTLENTRDQSAST